MSEIKLNLLDSHTLLVGEVHGSVGDRLVAALSAEPETIEELEAAFKRFEKDGIIFGMSACRSERCEIDDRPWDAGILVIDLAARIVACESTYSLPGRKGIVEYHDGHQCTGFPLRYRLSDDWLILRSIEDYKVRCKHQLKKRAAEPRLDTRAILYGEPLLNFIVQNALLLDVRSASTKRFLYEAIVDIHRCWLMTPREDLEGQSPRDVLFAKQDLIDSDLDSRVNQWSYFLEEPPCLSRDSHAYRFAGFGTHEWVMYYDLVRFLIREAVDRITNALFLSDKVSFTPSFSLGLHDMTKPETVSTVSIEAFITHLGQLKNKWLSEPRLDEDGYVPAEVIDNERRRRPEAMTGRSMVIDEDCPCCKLSGDLSEAGLEITFCHFDGAHMEDEFAFSWFATLEEWQEEQLKQEQWDRERRLRDKEQKKADLTDERPDEFDVPF